MKFAAPGVEGKCELLHLQMRVAEQLRKGAVDGSEPPQPAAAKGRSRALGDETNSTMSQEEQLRFFREMQR